MFYLENIWPGGAGGWIQTLIIKRPNNESGTWVEMNTNETTILEWAENSPGNAEYGRMHVHNDKVNDPWILLEGSGTNMWMPTLCTIDTQKAYQQDWRTENNYPYRLFVKILGLCSSSFYDYRYVWVPDEYVYLSRLGSELRFIEDGHWQLSSEAYVKWTKKEYPIYSAKITASRWSMGLGKFDVNFENDLCTKGKEDKMVTITISACTDEEFTCFDGNCVSMDHRCDRIVDCPDNSDEKGCRILKIDKTTYIQEYPPITADEERSPIKIPINISVDVLNILDIDEVAGTFTVSFELHSTWFDPRLTYVNLKNNTDLNTLTEQEKLDVWSPIIVFGNTAAQHKVVIDRDVIARIRRLGEYVAISRHEAIKSYYFSGADNPITFSRIYDIEFRCSYDMAWYPFDLQRCELIFKPFGNSGEYVRFITQDINYYEKMDLSKYYIKQWKFHTVQLNTGTGVEGTITCKKIIFRCFLLQFQSTLEEDCSAFLLQCLFHHCF